VDALETAYAARYGNPPAEATFKGEVCVDGWATMAMNKGFNPPTYVLSRAEGDHWVAVNRSAGKLCGGQGVPPDVAPKIGCDT
jgi:hypothetical protein